MPKNKVRDRVKKKFKEYETSKDKIRIWEGRIRLIDLRLQSVQNPQLSDMPKGGKCDKDKFTESIAQKQELEKMIKQEQRQIDEIDLVLKCLELKHEEDYKIFKLKHLNDRTINYICVELGHGRTTVIDKLGKLEREFVTLLSY